MLRKRGEEEPLMTYKFIKLIETNSDHFCDVVFPQFSEPTIKLRNFLQLKLSKNPKIKWTGIIICTMRDKVRVINFFTGEVLLNTEGCAGTFIDSKRMVLAKEEQVFILDIDSWEPICTLELDNPITVFCLLRNSNLACGEEGFVKIFDIDTSEQVCELELPAEYSDPSEVHKIIELHDGKLATGTHFEVYIWDVSTQQLVQTLPTPTGAYSLIELSDKTLCIGAGNVTVWDPQTATHIRDIWENDYTKKFEAASPDNEEEKQDKLVWKSGEKSLDGVIVIRGEDNEVIICASNEKKQAIENDLGWLYCFQDNGNLIYNTNSLPSFCRMFAGDYVHYAGNQRIIFCFGCKIILWDMQHDKVMKELVLDENVFELHLHRIN
jgi:hypothetical protein